MKTKLYPHDSNYAVGIDGTVWSIKSGKWKRLKPTVPLRRSDYPKLNISNRIVSVHTLVLETFIGLCPKGLEACHNDGNVLNNCVSNLRWDTHTNNMLDKIKHGTTNRGEQCGMSKLTDKDILGIRLLHKLGVAQTVIAALFGTANNTISLIVNRLR